MKLWKIKSNDYIGEGTGTVYTNFHSLKVGTLAYNLGDRLFLGINREDYKRTQAVPESCRTRIKCTKKNLRAFAKQFK